jgi:hypothetical protein
MQPFLPRLTFLALLGAAFSSASSADTAQGSDALPLGSRRELFVDDSLIEKFVGATALRLHPPTAQEIAIKFDQLWEGNASGYMTVMRDGDPLRMIYRGHRMIWTEKRMRMANSPVVCYAESRDGLTWSKPNLGLFAWRGPGAKEMRDPKANNIVWPGSTEANTFVPFLDTRPGCPADEKFKAVGGVQKTGLLLFKSPDAIHWTKVSDKPIFTGGTLDSMNTVCWDAERNRYVLYFRAFAGGELGKGLRLIGMAHSPDLHSWSEPVLLEYPGSPPQQMYTNQIAPYLRAPHIWMGFPTRYVDRPMTDQLRSLEPTALRAELTAAYARIGSDLTDGVFMSSRDGVRFRRWDEAFLRPGPQAEGRWMYGDNYQNYGLYETKSSTAGAPNEISMLFSEGYWREELACARRYSMRLDGFVSLNAPFSGGEVITKPLTFTGSELTVNYATSAAGSLRVEIQDSSGNPFPGFSLADTGELVGDSVEQAIHWKNGANLGALAGKPLRLRFVLKDADLYSFVFK